MPKGAGVMRFDAVLFDLDGTLVDSAPDLAGAVNDLLELHGRDPLPYQVLRPLAGSGARGMVGAGFGVGPGDEAFPALREAFLKLYEGRLLRSSGMFEAVSAVLDRIEQVGAPWGVVTNKAAYLAEPLLQGLALRQRAAVVVAGDTTPHTKPHPAPLLHAAQGLGLPASRCVYVGDDARDIQAGRSAGMTTVAAAWGYLGAGAIVEQWGADHVAATPQALLNWLELP
jgi:N-acetyl-D-muramate 6-phosphate phosphatase